MKHLSAPINKNRQLTEFLYFQLFNIMPICQSLNLIICLKYFKMCCFRRRIIREISLNAQAFKIMLVHMTTRGHPSCPRRRISRHGLKLFRVTNHALQERSCFVYLAVQGDPLGIYQFLIHIQLFCFPGLSL